MLHLLVSLVLIALAAAAGWFVMLKLRAKRYERLAFLAKSGNVDEFNACLATNMSRALISPYAKGRLRLMLAGSKGSKNEAREAVNELMKLNLTGPQRLAVATDAFASLASMEDVKGCSRLLREIEGLASEETCERYRCYFDTVMRGLGIHEGELKKRLSRLDGTPARRTRGHVEYLLAKAYFANGRTDEARGMRLRAANDLSVSEEQLEGAIDVAACL